MRFLQEKHCTHCCDVKKSLKNPANALIKAILLGINLALPYNKGRSLRA
jgi:hypothetical protein